MKTAVAVTSEIDDLDLAVNELVSRIKEKLSFENNSIGIAYCDADMDVAAFGELLSAELGIDVVGLTTTATIEKHSGYNDMGAVLSVMTADDVVFSIGFSENLDKDSFKPAIKTVYEDARGRLQNDPELILIFAPYIADITSDNYIETLDEASGGIPIFGGVATDHFDLLYQKTFYNGREFTGGLVFLLVGGNIKPVFALEHHFTAKVEKKGPITKSAGNLIERVGDQTFKEFVASMVPVPDDDEMVIYNFQSTPFIMELPDYEKDEQPVVRALCSFDHTTGAGGFLSKMPEGSSVYLSVLQRDNLKESCNGALAQLAQKMNMNRDYQYSMVFISTCNGRHLLMGESKDLESGIITESMKALSSDLDAAGFYGFGEICPTGIRDDGTAKNRFHNLSFALCAV